jgi:hypothetical protein
MVRCITYAEAGIKIPFSKKRSVHLARMALTLVGFASIPRWLTMKPRSLLEGTLKMHFSGLSFQR